MTTTGGEETVAQSSVRSPAALGSRVLQSPEAAAAGLTPRRTLLGGSKSDGAAVDAVARGLRTLLLLREKTDRERETDSLTSLDDDGVKAVQAGHWRLDRLGSKVTDGAMTHPCLLYVHPHSSSARQYTYLPV